MFHGHSNVTNNECFDCKQDLRADDGTHSEYHYDDGKYAFAAAVCNYCKLIRVLIQEAPSKMRTFDEIVIGLKSARTKANYAVMLWSLTKIDQDEQEITERRYCLNLDGSIVTRKDVCDLQRKPSSFVTDGWEVYTPKNPPKTLRQAMQMMSDSLEPKGYRRLF